MTDTRWRLVRVHNAWRGLLPGFNRQVMWSAAMRLKRSRLTHRSGDNG